MTIHRDLSLCHPKAAARFAALANDLIRAYEAGSTKTFFKVFETTATPTAKLIWSPNAFRKRDLS